MVPKALQALEKAMEFGDWPTVVRAAQIILDRAGMGPNATLTIEEKQQDLSKLTSEELEARARRVFTALQQAKLEAQRHESSPQDGDVIEHDSVPLLPAGRQGEEGHVS
jgi:hypothetical protein